MCRIHSMSSNRLIVGLPYSASPVSTRKLSSTAISPPPCVCPQRTNSFVFGCACITVCMTFPTTLLAKWGKKTYPDVPL